MLTYSCVFVYSFLVRLHSFKGTRQFFFNYDCSSIHMDVFVRLVSNRDRVQCSGSHHDLEKPGELARRDLAELEVPIHSIHWIPIPPFLSYFARNPTMTSLTNEASKCPFLSLLSGYSSTLRDPLSACASGDGPLPHQRCQAMPHRGQ